MRQIGAENAIQSSRGTTSGRHNNLNVFSILAACLVFGLCQTGCIGLTGSSSSNPLLPPGSKTPALTVSPTTLSFGTVALGTNTTQNIKLSNSGTATLTISNATTSGSGFSIVGGSPSLSIAAGQSQTIQVKFAPLAMGGSSGSLAVTSNDPKSPKDVTLTGTGGQSQIAFAPDSLTFGNVSVGGKASQIVTISNNGNIPLTITSVSIAGAEYSMSGITAPDTLNPGQSISFTATFAPTVAGSSKGTVAITSNAPNFPQTIALDGTGVPSSSVLTVSPLSVNFGNLNVGSSTTQNISLTNTGTTSLTISQITTSGIGFSSSGVTVPLTLTGGQSATLTARYSPSSAGSASGSITASSNASDPSVTISLTGTGTQTQPQITPNPANVAFGNVNVGGSSPQTITFSNSGNAALTITQITASGTGYSVSGFSLPITVAPGASSPITATFAPTSPGSPAGSISITSNSPGSPTTIAMTGTGVQSGLTANPASVSFGNVSVGSNGSQTVTLNNTGNSTLTISALTASGTGYSVNGFTLPVSIGAGANSTFAVKFAPSATGSVSGNVSITSNAPGSPLTISLSGMGVQPAIAATPSTVAFGNVTVGSPNSQTIRIQNTGTATLTISQASVGGTGFSINGLTIPVNIAAGGNTTFNVIFAPNAGGAMNGSISLTNNSAASPLAIALSGTGVAATYLLNASTTSYSFGNINVGSKGSMTATLTNAGNSNITVSGMTFSGIGFGASGVSSGSVIAPGQTATLTATFTPSAAGNASGNVTINSNAANSPLTISLSGAGAQAVQHSVTLSWTASTSTVVGYNVYRGSTSGGPYTLVTGSPVAGTSYTDSTVLAGQTYFYVVTAVDASGNESVYSNEVSAVVPTP